MISGDRFRFKRQSDWCPVIPCAPRQGHQPKPPSQELADNFRSNELSLVLNVRRLYV